MTDRMKEALFSSLGDLQGMKVLDLYAGSGSLGLEALSRGAERAVFVDSARDAVVKLEQNIAATGFEDRSEVVWSDVTSALTRSPDDRSDLIFLDPPYGLSTTHVQRDLEAIVMGGFLSDTGRVVVHRPVKDSKLQPLGLELTWSRDYGQAHLYVFSHEEED